MTRERHHDDEQASRWTREQRLVILAVALAWDDDSPTGPRMTYSDVPPDGGPVTVGNVATGRTLVVPRDGVAWQPKRR